MAAKIGAPAILALLRAKHSNDVFVDECKDGPTFVGNHFRLDAWVMPRSWTKPETTGYEIKVSRSDFLRDEKWQAYLQLCHRFYFVAPPGVIQVEELPAEAGLMVTSKNGTRLFTKKKAPARVLDVPESLWRYLLMCRTRVIRERSIDPVEQWQQWLAEKDERKHVGWNVSRKIRELVKQRIEAVEKENGRLRKENETLAGVRQMLEAMGITSVNEYRTRQEAGDRLRALAADRVPAKIDADIGRVIQQLTTAREAIAALRAANDETA